MWSCQVLQLLRFLELRVKIFRRDRSAPETHESGVCRTNGEGERGRALAVPIHTDMIILRARWWPGKGGGANFVATQGTSRVTVFVWISPSTVVAFFVWI